MVVDGLEVVNAGVVVKTSVVNDPHSVYETSRAFLCAVKVVSFVENVFFDSVTKLSMSDIPVVPMASN